MVSRKKRTNSATWVWMPHAGHFICGHQCRFHLTTFIPTNLPDGIIVPKVSSGVIVSTVGEYFPDSSVREILAQSRGIVLRGMGDERDADWIEKCGFEEIGCNRKYETMVFPAAVNENQDGQCCPYRASDWGGLDFSGYNDPAEAYQGHLAMCDRWHSLCVGENIVTHT